MGTENPCHLKLEYLQKYAVGDIFIETGTYVGDGVNRALEHGFKEIHSIELNDELYTAASAKFKNNPGVKIWHGDSCDILPKLIEQYKDKELTVFLDAHASGSLVGGKFPSPLLVELETMAEADLNYDSTKGITRTFKPKPYTIFVDDRRLLGSAEWGFVQEADVIQRLKTINEKYKVIALDGHVPNDVICATLRDIS